MTGAVRRWTGRDQWGTPFHELLVPPNALHGDPASWAETLHGYRTAGVPLLGKRQARQWLKELGARRRAAGEGR